MLGRGVQPSSYSRTRAFGSASAHERNCDHAQDAELSSARGGIERVRIARRSRGDREEIAKVITR